MDINNFFQSKNFRWLVIIIGSLAVLLLVFQLGISVGTRQTAFSYRWGENYHRTFGGPRGGFLQNFAGDDFVDGHGTAGAIIKIDGNTLIIRGRDNLEKSINVDGGTVISRGQINIKILDLTVDDRVVVIGSPQDDGTIAAKFIRVFDASNNMPPPGPRPLPF